MYVCTDGTDRGNTQCPGLVMAGGIKNLDAIHIIIRHIPILAANGLSIQWMIPYQTLGLFGGIFRFYRHAFLKSAGDIIITSVCLSVMLSPPKPFDEF